ncbi:hypothetical protein H6G00_01690 [Leptolyngbya sp. FACHB-541]|uniref:hypothetical protein n=1 Tax=Leptolyngbya sp. FACHB-541 TaxID=2692810 RepID=UPI00168420AC|nr:hypothetical protein [Leptolyngbya sp. FACHB-541]MBD1995343.1 hypothetical protein [Leptolyngbya sp. FACHB-541]
MVQPSITEQIKGRSNWKEERKRWEATISKEAFAVWHSKVIPRMEQILLRENKEKSAASCYGTWKDTGVQTIALYFLIHTDPVNPDEVNAIAHEIPSRNLKKELGEFGCPKELIQACKKQNPRRQLITVFVHLPLTVLNWHLDEFEEEFLAQQWASIKPRESEFFNTPSDLIEALGGINEKQIDAYQTPDSRSRIERFIDDNGKLLIPIGLAGYVALQKKGVVLVLKEGEDWTARYLTEDQVPAIIYDYQDPGSKVEHYLKTYEPETSVVIVVMYPRNATYKCYKASILVYPPKPMVPMMIHNVERFLPPISPSLQQAKDGVSDQLERENVRLEPKYHGITY